MSGQVGESESMNLNLLVPEMIHAKYCPIWCSSSWEEDF